MRAPGTVRAARRPRIPAVVRGAAVRVVLGNQHRLFLDALTEALSQEGVMVVAQATSPREVLAAVARHEPDICLLGTSFPDSSGLEILRVIRSRHQAVKVVMLSDTSDPVIVAQASDAGAAGFIWKEQRITEIVRTLTRVLAGEWALGTTLTAPGVGRFGSQVSYGDCLLRPLTMREQEVLMLMMEGESTKQIARSLAIGLCTARTHVQSVLVKLGAHSRLEATSMVARAGVLGTAGQYSSGSLAQATAASG
jgi:two-component system, NarL family, nitrate/nitrite response regulator NarL